MWPTPRVRGDRQPLLRTKKATFDMTSDSCARSTRLSSRRVRLVTRGAWFLVLGAALLLTQPNGRAQAQGPDALKFRTNIFIQGDYVVAGVNLRNTAGQNGSPAGIARGTISINTVPQNATVVSALLY